MKDLVLCFSTPLWLTFIFCNFRGFCPGEDFVPKSPLLMLEDLIMGSILTQRKILNLKEKLLYEKFNALEKFYLAG